MHKIVNVLPLKGYKLSIKFIDNVEGIVDVNNLKGKGVFSAWNDEAFFNQVSVDAESNTVSWPGGIDLCPDVLYAEILGMSIDSVLKSGVGV